MNKANSEETVPGHGMKREKSVEGAMSHISLFFCYQENRYYIK